MTRIRFDGCDLSPHRGTPVAARLASENGERRPRSAGGAARRRGARLPQPRSPRARREPRRSRTSSTRASAPRSAFRSSTPTSAPPGRRPRAASISWSRPAPRPARRSRSTCRSSTTSCGRRKHRVLYLYPTKALAQDQFRTLTALARAEAAAGDLRRRHADRAALADPQVVERDPDQPGHGPHRPAPEPRALGRGAREPPLRRRRRGARLPRRVRLARRERAAAPPPDRGDLRLRAAVPARHRDDREPGRARRSRCSGRR